MKYHLIAMANSCNRVYSRDQVHYSLGHKITFKRRGLARQRKGNTRNKDQTKYVDKHLVRDYPTSDSVLAILLVPEMLFPAPGMI